VLDPELQQVIVDYSTDDNPHKGNRGVARAWHAAKNSWSGLVFAVREESAFRQELTLAACLIPLALLLPFGAIERLLLIGSIVLVLIVELVNSGVEAAVDRISFEHHGLSKRAKDYGSAAVMLALLVCAMFWITLGWQLASANPPDSSSASAASSRGG
jgi:diacylglycerol kinase (ATP)